MNDTQEPARREQLIALAQWWSGWCVDEGHDELGWLLTDLVQQMRDDRPRYVAAPLGPSGAVVTIPADKSDVARIIREAVKRGSIRRGETITVVTDPNKPETKRNTKRQKDDYVPRPVTTPRPDSGKEWRDL